MRKKHVLILTGLALVVLLMAAYLLYDRLMEDSSMSNFTPTQTETTEAGQITEGKQNGKEDTAPQDAQAPVPAPDFTVVDADGNAVSLSDFQGQPVIVNLWASWCGPCKMEMPDFDEFYAAYGEEIVFMMVNMTDGNRETIDVASEFIEEQGYSFPVYFDTEFEAAIAYNATSIPATYFIDADGNVAGYARGAIGADILQQGIELIYNEE